MNYHVISHREAGQFRGGYFNQGLKTYEPGAHTAAQLAELLHDPHHSVVVGGEPLTEEHIAALLEADKPAAKAPAKGAK